MRGDSVNNDISSLGFAITNNVYIDVVNKKTGIVNKHIEKHNKATRQMVTGILRYLCGHFTDTTKNKNPQYNTASKYIPCYAGFGDANIALEDGIPKSSDDPRIPIQVDDSWSEYVPYESRKLEREFFTTYSKDEFGNDYITPSDSRLEIRDIRTTIEESPAGDMDSIYFYIEADTNYLNRYYGEHAVYVSELGLFAGNRPGDDDMLAYVRLANYMDGDTPNTNVLYVKPEDTVVIRWIITVAAIGKDSILRANIKDEHDNIVTNDVLTVPQLVEAHIEVIPDQPEPSPTPEDTTPQITVDTGTWYDRNDPVVFEDSTFTGTLSYRNWSSSPGSMSFDIIDLYGNVVYPPGQSLMRPTYLLDIDITYPGLGISQDGFPMLRDGTELQCQCKVNGTVVYRDSGVSTTVDLDAGYFGNLNISDGAIEPILYIPTDATTLTLVTYNRYTKEILRQDTYQLDFTYAPRY